jgi:hypothetical protein
MNEFTPYFVTVTVTDFCNDPDCDDPKCIEFTQLIPKFCNGGVVD